MSEHTDTIQDYDSVRIYRGGIYAGQVKYYLRGKEVATETAGGIYEDREGIHALLPDNGRLPPPPPPPAKVPDPAKAVSQEDFAPERLSQLKLFLAENDSVARDVAELYLTINHVERQQWKTNRGKKDDANARAWADCFLQGEEGDAYLTWLVAWMCNFIRPFGAGEALASHPAYWAVIGKARWPLKYTSWRAAAEEGTWIYMEYRKALTPVEGK